MGQADKNTDYLIYTEEKKHVTFWAKIQWHANFKNLLIKVTKIENTFGKEMQNVRRFI